MNNFAYQKKHIHDHRIYIPNHPISYILYIMQDITRWLGGCTYVPAFWNELLSHWMGPVGTIGWSSCHLDFFGGKNNIVQLVLGIYKHQPFILCQLRVSSCVIQVHPRSSKYVCTCVLRMWVYLRIRHATNSNKSHAWDKMCHQLCRNYAHHFIKFMPVCWG